MNATKILRTFRALGPVDLHSIRRDPMLKWVIAFPIPIILVLRFGLPALQARLLEVFVFDISPYYVLFASFITLAMPLLIGMVVGFLLLDQKDDNTLLALQVTPVSLNGYLLYRILTPLVLSVITAVLVIKASGMVEIGWLALTTAALAAAPAAPLAALFLASFASNKVQGFALSKGASVILVPPLIAYFVDSGWQWAFALVPTYWPVRLFWILQSGEPQALLFLAVGLLYQALLIFLLLKRFNRIMRQ
jgi:fluoroquinolone transport system permease protein